jgi:serine protease Do
MNRGSRGRWWCWLVLLMLTLAGCKLMPQTAVPAGAARASTESVSPATEAALPAPQNRAVSLHLPPLGLVLREMTADERTARNIEHGVWVVVAVGASAIAGVREDDIVLTVDAAPVRDVDSFWIQMDRANWQCRLGILRKGAQIYVDIGKAA